jgi:hypothetical protein
MLQFSKMIMATVTQLELLVHGWKFMKANFSIFPGEHNHQIGT